MAHDGDIADSSDWLNTPLASISKVEAGLRCQVCKDFYKTPMITSCAHTFCSLCIRRCYSDDQKCPACRAGGQESQLRKNVVLEEVVEAFQTAREAALQFARDSSPQPRSTSPKRKLELVAGEEIRQERPSKRTRASSRRTEPAEQSRNYVSPYAPHEDKLDGDFTPDVRSTRSSWAPKGKENTATRDVEVECPICGNFVKESTINSHIDNNCFIPPKPSSTLRLEGMRPSRNSSFTTSAPVRLPFLSYSGMKEPALKKKLADLGIPSWGTKLDLQKRHKAWLSIWNSNCDAKNPRPMYALLSDLDEWERTQGASAPRSSTTLSMGSVIKNENFDGTGWRMQHADNFKDLIEKARKSRPAPTPTKNSTSMEGLSSLDLATVETAPAASNVPTQIKPATDVINEIPVELPIMVSTTREVLTGGNEAPPSSQMQSHQFKASPRGMRYFEDVEDPIVVDNEKKKGLGIMMHHQ